MDESGKLIAIIGDEVRMYNLSLTKQRTISKSLFLSCRFAPGPPVYTSRVASALSLPSDV